MKTLRRHWRIAVPVGLVVIAAGWWLAFSFFGVQTLFFDDKVDEDGPVFASGAAATDEPADVPVVEEEVTTTTVPPAEPTSTPPDPVPTEPAPSTTAAPEVATLLQGTFGARSHPGSGTAVVLGDGTDQRFLRFEDDFSTDNGPDLDVYLSTAPPDAPEGAFDDDFVDLGELKGNIGAQNYEIPADVDLDQYSTVVVWCVRFSVAFTTAALT